MFHFCATIADGIVTLNLRPTKAPKVFTWHFTEKACQSLYRTETEIADLPLLLHLSSNLRGDRSSLVSGLCYFVNNDEL